MQLKHSTQVVQISSALLALSRLLGEEPSLPGHMAAGLGTIIHMLGERLDNCAADLMDLEMRS
jgi:hypothetical protein